MPNIKALMGQRGQQVQGLTASDRTAEEQQEINEVMGYKQEPDTTVIDTLIASKPAVRDSVGMANASRTDLPSIAPTTISDIENSSRLAEFNRRREQEYQPVLNRFMQQYGVDRNSTNLTAKEKIQKVAGEYSSYYKRYNNTDLLSLTDADYKKLAAEYDTMLEMYGEDDANMWLDRQIKNKVAENQSWFSQYWDAASHLIPAIEGGIIQGIGNVAGLIGVFDSDTEETNFFNRRLDAMLDNPITRYGRDLERSGASHVQDIMAVFGLMNETAAERVAATKATATKYNPEGIGNDAIVGTDEQENSLFSAITVPQALQSTGFTALSMLWGQGEAILANKLFGMVSKGIMGLYKAGKAFTTLEKVKQGLTAVKQAQNWTDRLIIPGTVGSLEGAVNGLDTKIQSQQSGMNQLNNAYEELVRTEASELYRQRIAEWENSTDLVETVDDTGNRRLIKAMPMPTPEGCLMEVWEKYKNQYNQAAAQVDYAATLAGITDYGVNSFINGLGYSTLKAGLLAPSTQEALRNSKYFGAKSKAFGWLYDRPQFEIGPDGTVVPKISKSKLAFGMTKELLGESIEEFTQTNSSDAAQAASENNIKEFIRNKFYGDGDAKVGEQFASDLGAYFSALGQSIFSKEALQSGILGGLGSTLGTIAGAGRNYRRDADGKLVRNEWYTPKGILGNLHSGLNTRGEQETAWDVIKRITPWRSGIVNAYNDYQAELDAAKYTAKNIEEWLKDPKNKAKWDHAVGTANWLDEMFSAAEGNDQYSYRKAQLGRFINDIFMLDKLKGTDFYDSMVTEMQLVSELDAGSEQGKKLIETMRQSSDELAEMSDAEIAERLRRNANRMLGLMNDVQTESDRIDNLLGRVDEDTKQSLIYGKMMQEDLLKRREQLRAEIDAIISGISSSTNSSGATLSEDIKKLILKHGSLTQALHAKEDLEDKKEKAKDRIKAIETIDSKKRTEAQEKELIDKKQEVKSVEEELKGFKALDTKDGVVDSNLAQLVLNEQEIMNLDAETRGEILRQGGARQYYATHQNRGVIENLNLSLHAVEKQIADMEDQIDGWTDNQGKARKGHNKQVETARKKLTELNKQRSTLLEQLATEQGRMNAKPIYSQAQQEVIDNLIRQGSERDANFLDKVVDLGRIEKGIRDYYEGYNEILSDPQSFQNFVQGVKLEAAVNKAQRQAERIADIEDFGKYSAELDALLANASDFERNVISRALASQNSKWKRELMRRTGALEEIDALVELEEPSNRGVVRRRLYDKKAKETKTNLDRYIENQEHATELFGQLDKLEDLDSNDISLLQDAFQYLIGQGVDVTDKQSVVAALSELNNDEELGGKFREYVEAKNEKRVPQQRTAVNARERENEPPVFTTIQRVVGHLTGMIDGRLSDIKDEQNAKPVVGTPSAQPTTTPTPAPTPTPEGSSNADAQQNNDKQPQGLPSIFQQYESPDAGHFVDGNGTVSTGAQIALAEEETPQTEIEQLFSQVMPINTARQLNVAEVILGKDPKVTSNDVEIESLTPTQLAWQYFKNLAVNNDERYDSLSDFLESLSEQISELESMAAKEERPSETNYAKAAKMLGTLHRRLNISGSVEERTTFAKRSSHAPILEGQFIMSVDFGYVVKRHPDSWIASFYNEHDILKYIREHNVETSQVFFITDSALSREAMSSMGESYDSASDMPIVIAVQVEAPRDINTTTAIEVGGTWYQPVGILPSTTSMNDGALHTGRLRELASKDAGRHLIMYNGTPLTSSIPKGGVLANHVDASGDTKRVNSPSVNNSFISGILDLLGYDEREKLKGLNRDEILASEEYRAMKKQVLEGGGFDWGGHNQPLYIPDNLNPTSKKGHPMAVIRLTPGESMNRSHTATLQEICVNGTGDDVVSFNSKTNHVFSKVLRPLFAFNVFTDGKYDVSAKIVTSVEEGTKEAERLTEALMGKVGGKKVRRGVSDYLYLNAEKGWRLKVKYNEGASTVGTNIADSHSVYEVYLENSKLDSSTKIGEIVAGSNNIEAAKECLRNLMYDSNTGEVRDCFNWQLSKNDIMDLKGTDKVKKQRAQENISELIDDDVLTFAGSSLVYDPICVKLRVPNYTTQSNQPINAKTTVANSDNANASMNFGNTPLVEGAVEGENGNVIEPDSGIVMERGQNNGIEDTRTEAMKKAESIVSELHARSENLKLSEDENYYIEIGPGGEEVKYLRVTSLKSADESWKDGRDWQDTGWKTPSTSIGNTVDTIVRDFFAGELKGSYPNITDEEVKKFVEEQLQPFKDSLDASGITIESRDIKAKGTVTVVNAEGKETKVKVAGTLDLLGYDRNGNFYIFDMKTVRTDNHPIAEQVEKKKLGWSLQLSLYADLLEQEFGHRGMKFNANNLRIIPIGVKYPSIKGDGSMGTSLIGPTYSEDKKGQLSMNYSKRSIKYKELKPQMFAIPHDELVRPGRKPINLQWDKLTPEEKALAELLQQETAASQQSASDETTTPTTAHVEKASTAQSSVFTHEQDLILDDSEVNVPTAPPIINKTQRVPMYEALSEDAKEVLKTLGIENAEDYAKYLYDNEFEGEQVIKQLLSCAE